MKYYLKMKKNKFDFNNKLFKCLKKRNIKFPISSIFSSFICKNIYIIFLLIFILLFIYNKDLNNQNVLQLNQNKNKFFFFEKNQDELKYCDNYGLFIYDYYDRKREYSHGNIGDYFQSLAALQYLPKNCKPYFVDRDLVRYYYGPKIKLIMNSWNLLLQGNKLVSQQITPIFLSYHLSNNGKLPDIYINDLKKYSPIGCRDKKTRDQFIKYGIDAYFSSCLTTTLDIDYSINENERTNEIIFADFKLGNNPQVDDFLLSLKAYNLSSAIFISHIFHTKLNHIERFRLAKRLLNRYSRARLIITTRIHGALPCLSFNTPVILINKKYNYRRFPGLYELLNTIGINKEKKFEIRVNIDDNGLIYNPKNYLIYANKLKDRLRKF